MLSQNLEVSAGERAPTLGDGILHYEIRQAGHHDVLLRRPPQNESCAPQPRPLPLTVIAGQPVAARKSATENEYSLDPLYVFSRGLQWRQEKDTVAGWELVALLRSGEAHIRTLAASQLAAAEHMQLGARQLRRAVARLNRPASHSVPKPAMHERKEADVNTPYGLQMIDSCLTCPLRKDGWFCGLSSEGLKRLNSASHLCTYPDGALLFVEGQAPRGAYVLCSGKVKISTTSREGKVLILKIAEPGEVLGLSAVISGQPFEITAETDGPCQVNFVEREALLERIAASGELGLRASMALSREFQTAYRDIHDLVLARSSAGKLAKLLLSWTSNRKEPGVAGEIRVRASLTHEEMAQMIGSSRETVTRLLGDLKKKELIRLEGSTLVIRNRMALEALAA